MALIHGAQLVARIEPHLGWADRVGEKADLLRAILSSATDPKVPGGIIPVVEGPSVRFLACAGTPAEWERLRPLLLAYVGVTISDFDGSVRPPTSDDQTVDLLRDGGATVIAELAPRNGLGRQCVEALASMIRTLASAPPEADFTPRSTAQLLAAFRMAAAAEDRPAAEASIAALRAEMRLDALNLAFLQVQLDAALGDWAALRGRWFFAQLCISRRPPRVTAALAESLYRCEISPYEEGLDRDGLVELFRERCLSQFGRLYAVRPSNPSTPVALAFLLAAASAPVPDIDAARSVLQSASGPEIDELAVRVMAARLFGDELTTDPDDSAKRARDPLETAVLSITPGSPTALSSLRAALRAAYALQTISSATHVVGAVNALNDGERSALLADRASMAIWQELLAVAGGDAAPSDWVAFLQAAPNMSYESARRWADTASKEIPITHELASPDATGRFVAALEQWFTSSEVTFYAVLPHLLEWIKDDPAWPNLLYRDLYVEILELLVLGSGRASEAVSAVGMLLSGLLSVGVTQAQYRTILSDLATWIGTAIASRDLDPVLDLADVVANNPCPDTEVRSRFWSVLLAAVAPHAARLTSVQRAALRDMAATLGSAEWVTDLATAATASTGQVRPLPRGFQIGVYTLLESAGRRVQRALEALHPEAQVDLFTDHVASPRLLQAAARADLFVVCWAAAKHAATQAAANSRDARLPTIYPRGVGSASVLREIEEQLEAHLRTPGIHA